MYIYIYVYTHIYIYTYICTHTHTHTHMYIYIYIYTKDAKRKLSLFKLFISHMHILYFSFFINCVANESVRHCLSRKLHH